MNCVRRFALLFAAAAILIQSPPTSAQIITHDRTPAGLAFRHVHMPEEHAQALYFAWKDTTAGSMAGKEALPTLATALILEGPRGMSRSAMIEDLRDLRATVNLGATVDVTQGHLIAPPEKFADVGRLLARTLAEPALSADRLADIAKSRAVSSRQAEGNPESQAQRLLARLMIGEGSYRSYATTAPAIFERVTMDDIDRWRKDVLVREGIIVVAAGPLGATEIARTVDRLFADLPQAGKLPPPAKPILQAPGKLVVLERPVVQTIIAAGGPMALAVTPDLARTQLAVAALGGNPSARVQPVDLETRTLVIRTAVANEKAKGALAAIREEYARLIAEGVTDEELEALKRLFVTSHRDRLRWAPSVAANVLTQVLHHFPDEYLASYEGRVGRYDRTAVNTDMRATFPKQPLTAVAVAPSADGFAADCVIRSPDELARCD